MAMTKTTVCVAVVASLALGASAPSHAQTLDYDRARELAAATQSRVRVGGATEEFATQLTQALARCEPGPVGAACRAVLRFGLGALAEHRAGAEPGEAARHLGNAIAHYEAVLAETPGHAPTLQALVDVYVRRGEAARAEALLRAAVTRHPDDDVLAVMLGDFLSREKRWDGALRAYALAAARNPSAELPRRRMVDTHVELLPQQLAEFRTLLGQLARPFPSAAEAGYRALVGHAHPADPSTAEAALVRLVSVLAAGRRVTTEALATLPASWTPVVELRRYVETPTQRPNAPWWLGSIERRHVLAKVALALGEQTAVEAGEIADAPARLRAVAGAAERWEVGLRFAPDYGDYAGRLRSRPVARLDILTALALHYFKFPSLDPGERKFNTVVQDLFRTKTGAYVAADLAGIQRHHTILGTIFAQKQAWRPRQIDGAMFQLENALKTAAKRDVQERTYQPLPELRTMLAEGLAVTGEPARARATYVDAAQAYLDTDALREAGAMLAAARRVGLAGQPAAEAQRMTQLATMLATRNAIALAGRTELDPVTPGYAFAPSGQHAWVFGGTVSALSTDFVERQRFKAMADLAHYSRLAGQTNAAEALALRAFDRAVKNVQFLTGAGDLVRVERVRTQATQKKVLDWKPLSIDRAPAQASAPAKTWVLSDVPGGRPSYVSLSRDDLVAARVVSEFHAAPADERPDFRVTGGQVVLPAGEKTETMKPRLERLPGVGGVDVRPSLPASVPRK
jgi:tetratricopeptide (TPR) repeat protein